jgi:hypothetical protein
MDSPFNTLRAFNRCAAQGYNAFRALWLLRFVFRVLRCLMKCQRREASRLYKVRYGVGLFIIRYSLFAIHYSWL